jgi:hypothetical protein
MAAKRKTLFPGGRTIGDMSIIRQELTKVRCWVSGYEARGGGAPGIPGSHGLRLALMLIDDIVSEAAKRLK